MARALGSVSCWLSVPIGHLVRPPLAIMDGAVTLVKYALFNRRRTMLIHERP